MTSGTPRRHPVAAVAGASSGIGREIARVVAGDGYDLVLVARRRDRLEALAGEVAAGGGTARAVVADLASPDGVAVVAQARDNAPVEVSSTMPGVGGRGRFAVERDVTADLAMVQLNVISLVH